MNLELFEKDTVPIICNYGSDITGFSFVLTAKGKEPAAITINGVIVDAVLGIFQFPRTADTFPVGSHNTTITTIYPDATDETSDVFITNVLKRL